jgi:hypothetical protein
MLTIFAGLTYCLALGTWMQWPWWLNLVLGIIFGEAVRENAYTVSQRGLRIFPAVSSATLADLDRNHLWSRCWSLSWIQSGQRHIMQQKLEFYERAQHDDGTRPKPR